MNHELMTLAGFKLAWHIGTRTLDYDRATWDYIIPEGFSNFCDELKRCSSENQIHACFVRNEHMFDCFGPIHPDLRLGSLLHSHDIGKALDDLALKIQQTWSRCTEDIINYAHDALATWENRFRAVSL